ncbi:hypothetical protein DXG01_012154 [Tephrocybe rancida]|nr:hypothetical protein DXG01_012154 [Tephrocybe rancida]
MPCNVDKTPPDPNLCSSHFCDWISSQQIGSCQSHTRVSEVDDQVRSSSPPPSPAPSNKSEPSSPAEPHLVSIHKVTMKTVTDTLGRCTETMQIFVEKTFSPSPCKPAARAQTPVARRQPITPESLTPACYSFMAPSSTQTSLAPLSMQADIVQPCIPAPDKLLVPEDKKGKFYTVTQGTEVGIFRTWDHVAIVAKACHGKWRLFWTWQGALQYYTEKHNTKNIVLVH